MSVRQNFSTAAGPSNSSPPFQTGIGVTCQGEVISCRQVQSESSRNSFDFVIDTANAQRVQIAKANDSKDLTAVKPFTPRDSVVQPAITRKVSQTETWEDIELQEWPTASRLAALSTDTQLSLSQCDRRMPVTVAAARQDAAHVRSGSFLARIWGQTKNLLSGSL